MMFSSLEFLILLQNYAFHLSSMFLLFNFLFKLLNVFKHAGICICTPVCGLLLFLDRHLSITGPYNLPVSSVCPKKEFD